MKIAITAGGTGGHIFPALAVALELRRMKRDVDLVWIGTTRSREVELCREHGIKIEVLDVVGISSWFSLSTIRAMIKYLQASFVVRSRFNKDRPDMVIAFGGYVCAPVLRAAKAAGIPYYIHEQNSVMGRVNRAFSAKAACTFLGCPLAAEKPAVGVTRLVGTPIRQLNRNYDMFTYPEEFDRSKGAILICGGSQGAVSMNDALVSAVRRFAGSGRQIIWQTGKVSFAKISCLFAGVKGVFVFESMADMYPYYMVATLLVCRSGASTLAEAAFFGLPCVMIPLPWSAGNHQWYNAGHAETQGWGIRVAQDQNCADNTEKAVSRILNDKSLDAAMSAKAMAASPDKAATLIASAILEKEIAGA